MILLDTHIWIWWKSRSQRLSSKALRIIDENKRDDGVGISVISCWEMAKLVERKRLTLTIPIETWIEQGLVGLTLFHLTPEIAIESTKLPGDFHKDPADQIIVATARFHGLPLLTVDRRILSYPYVTTL
ncbi:MAG: type II toxin-antitoxin system VapC family toxin [Chloroflexi bacterium]|nr:type II toxin-antitoxin system VapC family toxin [Chloroflexota bacterium]